jgi:hypothetical protein
MSGPELEQSVRGRLFLRKLSAPGAPRKLNQLLADTMTLRDMYKKHHWQVSGATFYQLHLLFDKHYRKQSELVDAMPTAFSFSWHQHRDGCRCGGDHTHSSATHGREEAPLQISRLLEGHEIVLKEARTIGPNRRLRMLTKAQMICSLVSTRPSLNECIFCWPAP